MMVPFAVTPGGRGHAGAPRDVADEPVTPLAPIAPRHSRRHVAFRDDAELAGARAEGARKTVEFVGNPSAEEATDDEDSGDLSPDHVVARKTLFLVRHGEAVHNIEERGAMERAAEEALADGCSPNTSRQRVEAARQEVLQDDALHDAALSCVGKAQARSAKAKVEELTRGSAGLPRPTAVLTSPLTRTLQTTAIIFPRHPGVHIRECLRERRTGLPCDERQPATKIRSRPSFAFMSSFNLMALERDHHAHTSGAVVEDKLSLRCRTLRIIDELLNHEDESICAVTHKGCLRELERGPLGRPAATEFGNCEVRVYAVDVRANGEVSARLLYGDDAAKAH